MDQSSLINLFSHDFLFFFNSRLCCIEFSKHQAGTSVVYLLLNLSCVVEGMLGVVVAGMGRERRGGH